MGIRMIQLHNVIGHASYAWPLSLVRYPMTFEVAEAYADSFSLTDDSGAEVAFQWADTRWEAGFLQSGTLCFTTDLPSGAHKRYTLRFSPIPQQQRHAENQNAGECDDTLAVEVNAAQGVFRLGVRNCMAATHTDHAQTPVTWLATGSLQGGVAVRDIRWETAGGAVFEEQRLVFTCEGERRYELLIRRIAGMVHLELEETLHGFVPEDAAYLAIRWEGLRPRTRDTRYRGREAIDDYIDSTGNLPYVLLPFDSWVSWHACQAAAFSDPLLGLTVGVFVTDTSSWRDGEYALWRSSETLALGFAWEAGSLTLVWRYPLSATGTRHTALAVYDCARDEGREHGSAYAEGHRKELYIDELWLWHALLRLDKVKHWVLEWEEAQTGRNTVLDPALLPETFNWWYFRRDSAPTAYDVEEMIGKLSNGFHQVLRTSPVNSREFSSWLPIIDLAASDMNAGLWEQAKAASALMAYVREDENMMPQDTMLAGHPNFLMDMKVVPAYMSALFPQHPHARRWRAHFEKAVALSLKYHVRPAVAAWDAHGGRWTENLGCYVWAALVPMVRAAWTLTRTGGDNVLLYPKIRLLAAWLLGTLSAPVHGRRSYPPQGAHAGTHDDPFTPPYVLRVLGTMLLRYDPLLGEQLLAVCPPDAEGFESGKAGDVWRQMLDGEHRRNTGTLPTLQSTAYTGYGFVLRAAVGSPGEMTVYVQQIDEGPNYRWGRAAEGGNGAIYYYADGQRYAYNRPEDVGDDNMGDVQGCSNFGVLVGHEYRSVGRSELSEPLLNFGFAQFVQVNAGPYAQPMYRSRSVLMSGNDYIAIYDEVADMRVRGRFSWFGHIEDPFPDIYQLKPGSPAVEAEPGEAIDGATRVHTASRRSRGRIYDGYGHFLTVVTHRPAWQPQVTQAEATPFGAIVRLNGRSDYVFRSSAEIDYKETNREVVFTGYAGIVRLHASGLREAAMFRGSKIGLAGITLELLPEESNACAEQRQAGSFSLVQAQADGRLRGEARLASVGRLRLIFPPDNMPSGSLFIDGESAMCERQADGLGLVFELPAGSSRWEWTSGQPVPSAVRLTRTLVSSGQAIVEWESVSGAKTYQVQVSADGERTWQGEQSGLEKCRAMLGSLVNGAKYHVRVRAEHDGLSGPWSEAYPLYPTVERPQAPEGLRIRRLSRDCGYALEWGMILGASHYRLYRSCLEADDDAACASWALVYEGEARNWLDEAAACNHTYAYCVAAINGNGEGERGMVRTTEPGGLVDWDPCPDEEFRRYTRSNEYGYGGFDYWANAVKQTLAPYPR